MHCGTPSSIAWPYLLGGLDAVIAIADTDSARAAARLAALGSPQALAGPRRSPASSSRGKEVTYYQLTGGEGSRTGALDVGAPAGTAVYAPVTGTVVSIRDLVLGGKRYGHRIDIVPSEAPSVVVSLTRLRADPALTVGSPVTKDTSKIGVVLDLSRVEKQALAGVTHDPGNHVTLEVQPTATLAYR